MRAKGHNLSMFHPFDILPPGCFTRSLGDSPRRCFAPPHKFCHSLVVSPHQWTFCLLQVLRTQYMYCLFDRFCSVHWKCRPSSANHNLLTEFCSTSSLIHSSTVTMNTVVSVTNTQKILCQYVI